MTVAALSKEILLACCGSSRWAELMLTRQPFETAQVLHHDAESIWWSLSEDDWLEAFSTHPKIGQKAHGESASSKWSRQEQSRAAQVGPEVSRELERLNREYERRFGFIFLICASGRPAEEILEHLRARIRNSRSEEIRNAASEQAKIMHLRLEKVLRGA